MSTPEQPAQPSLLNLNLGTGFAAVAAARAAEEPPKPAPPRPECLDCKRAQFDLARERERSDHLRGQVQALEEDLRAAGARLSVAEAGEGTGLVITLSDTVRRLQAVDLTQRRNVALAEIYVTELQQFIRNECHLEPPSLAGGSEWRRGEREGSAS